MLLLLYFYKFTVLQSFRNKQEMRSQNRKCSFMKLFSFRCQSHDLLSVFLLSSKGPERCWWKETWLYHTPGMLWTAGTSNVYGGNLQVDLLKCLTLWATTSVSERKSAFVHRCTLMLIRNGSWHFTWKTKTILFEIYWNLSCVLKCMFTLLIFVNMTGHLKVYMKQFPWKKIKAQMKSSLFSWMVSISMYLIYCSICWEAEDWKCHEHIQHKNLHSLCPPVQSVRLHQYWEQRWVSS